MQKKKSLIITMMDEICLLGKNKTKQQINSQIEGTQGLLSPPNPGTISCCCLLTFKLLFQQNA
jgi:hypothetical protein